MPILQPFKRKQESSGGLYVQKIYDTIHVSQNGFQYIKKK